MSCSLCWMGAGVATSADSAGTFVAWSACFAVVSTWPRLDDVRPAAGRVPKVRLAQVSDVPSSPEHEGTYRPTRSASPSERCYSGLVQVGSTSQHSRDWSRQFGLSPSEQPRLTCYIVCQRRHPNLEQGQSSRIPNGVSRMQGQHSQVDESCTAIF